MSHPTSAHAIDDEKSRSGGPQADRKPLATRAEYRGRGAHAAGDPWEGINALDAAVAAYNNISMMRQQIRTDERIHGVIEAGGVKAPERHSGPHAHELEYSKPYVPASRRTLLPGRKPVSKSAATATACEVNYIP